MYTYELHKDFDFIEPHAGRCDHKKKKKKK